MALRYDADGCVVPSKEFLERQELLEGLDEDSCCSFDEWFAAGYVVIRGAKSVFRDVEGIPQFTKEQVRCVRPRGDEYDGHDYEYDTEFE